MDEAKLNKYMKLTEKALQEAKLTKGLSERDEARVRKLLDMSKRYFSDAQHFQRKGDLVNAFAAINYAHCFLDAAALCGWLDVKGKSDLFMID